MSAMYKTCIYCNRKLGSNETVETFPVGRRLAFDQEKGRLWVICERCRRWNLSPLQERWDAIEECEREFRDTRLRYSTDNIGLARMKEGLELIRIGQPRRPEFAAWRYSKQFIRRRARQLIGATVRAIGYTLTSAAGLIVFFATDDNSKIIARVRSEDGTRLPIVRKDLKELQLERGAADDWYLAVPYRPREERYGFLGKRGRGERLIARLSGSTAIRAASHILPRINSFGGSHAEVARAVRIVEDVGDPERVFAIAPSLVGQTRFTRMDAETRLALEMAAHEESERRALEGELAVLEAAWREAEEIAAIADRLLVPESAEDWIRRQRKRLT